MIEILILIKSLVKKKIICYYQKVLVKVFDLNYFIILRAYSSVGRADPF